MRKQLFALALSLPLLAPLPASAADADAARAIVNRAIEAHGDTAALAKTRNMVLKSKGEVASFGAPVSATCEETLQLPDRHRWAFEVEAGAQKIPILLAVNGDKGWRSSGGSVKVMSKLELQEQRERAYAAGLMTLLPLTEEGVTLKPLPEIKVGDAPAGGVLVSRKDRPDVKLYFDKKTHLLVRLERPGKDAGEDVTVAYVLSEPKVFDGVRMPTKRVELVNGKKVAEWEMTDCRFPARLDASRFEKP